MRLFRFFLAVMVISLWLVPVAEPAYLSITDMDTSVVRLDINGRKFSEDFELYDDGEHVLLPLMCTGDLLDAKARLDPALMEATVLRSWDDREGRVNLNQQLLFWNEEEIIMAPPAVLGPGDFFVPLHVVESLMDADIEWIPEVQILFVSVERSLSKLRPMIDPGTPARSSEREAPMEMVPTLVPPVVSLGAVQYVLSYGVRSEGGQYSSEDSLAVSAYWQMVGIPVDLAVKGTGLTTSNPQWDLTRFTATYRSPQVEVVAGDSTLNLGRTLQNAKIRGLRLTAPPNWTATMLRAVTVIEGWVTPSSEVELRVNGVYFGKQQPSDGHYVFSPIPLQITKPNKVEIIVTDEYGHRTVETRHITATPRLLPAGKIQSVAGGGLTKSKKTGEWDSVVMGASVKGGVTSWLTAGGEIARQRDLDENRPTKLAGSVGLALRAADNLVFALDWLVSKPEADPNPPAQGVEFASNLRLGRTAWQGVVFYREPGLDLLSRTQSDAQGYKIIAEFDISQTFGLQASYESTGKVSDPEMPPAVKVEGVARWRHSAASTTVLRLQHVPNERDKAIITHRQSNRATGSELKLESEAEWTKGAEAASELTYAGARVELDKALSATSYLGVRYMGTASWPLSNPLLPSRAPLLKNTAQIDGTWMPGQYNFSGLLQLSDIRSAREDVLSFSQRKVALNASRSSGMLVTGVGTEIVHQESANVDGYMTNSLYLGVAGTASLSGLLRLDHTKPLWGEMYQESVAATLRGDLRLGNGFALGLTGQVKYRAPAAAKQDPDYFVGITLSQGIGFSSGGVRGFAAVDGRPMGYIEGTVYIDSNGNGKRDPGEKAVAGIPMALAGRRTTTDKNGRYCFEFVQAGTYLLGLDQHKLSADFTVLTDPVVVRVITNTNLSQDFAVALNGTADGTVFVDLNGDGKWQPDEPRPAWIKVFLDGEIEQFTDNRGNFSFGNLNLGRHELSICEEHLPSGTRAPAPVIIEITGENLDVWDIYLPLEWVGE